MAMEIEKIVMLYEKAETEKEKKEIRNIIEVLSSVFEKMLNDFEKYVITGEREKIDFTESMNALKRLNEFGSRYGMEFPLVLEESAAKVYIAQFGSQIVKMG